MNSVEAFRPSLPPATSLPARSLRSGAPRGRRRLRVALAGVLFGAIAITARSELIPATRLVDWTPGVAVGVPGGIPTNRSNTIDVTASPYYADPSGANDCSAAIQSAINAARSGDVVYLPAGTYRCDKPINVGYKNGITLRGAGNNTVLDNHAAGSTFLTIGGGSDYRWNWPTSGNVVTAGLTKGSTQLTLGDTSAYAVGQIIQLKVDNDPSLPVISVFGYEGMRRQMTRVTAKTGNTLTIFPALYGDYSASRAVVHVAQLQANFVGLEDLVINSANSTVTFTVCFEQCYGCWAKNVHIRYSSNYHLYVSDSVNCEIRHCYLDELNHTGSNGAGLLVNTVSGSLFEDNIIFKSFPHIEVNHGSSGNVIAYNYCVDSGPGVSIDSNHGPHNEYNLYEGNIAPNLQCDGYFGSASDDTIFRNWFNGILNNVPAWSISLNRFTREYSIVGNILEQPGYLWTRDGVTCGNPNMGNSAYSTVAPPWTDGWSSGAGALTQSGQNVSTSSPMFNSAQVGWFILTPGNNALATITKYVDPQHVTVNLSQTLTNVSYIVSPGPSGYQELDTGVAGTLVRKGNFNYCTNSIPAEETLGADSLPDSLFRPSKPDWFGTLAWPAFNPLNPLPGTESIPAGYRFVHGTDPLPAPTVDSTTSTTSTQPPLNVRISHAEP